MAAAGDARHGGRVARAEKYFADLSGQDYATHLGQCFDRSEMSDLMAQLRRSLPNLNRNLFGETNPRRLVALAKELGATLQLQNLPSPALRGFYVNDSAFSTRPLIVVNASHPPLGVAAAFWHEIGHHLTHDIFGRGRDRTKLNFSSSYQDHLDRPEELVADIVTTLGAYPAPTAKRLFGKATGINSSRGSVRLVSKASRHIRSLSGLEVSQGGSLKNKLHMVAGMIHLAKLRIALREGYGI